MERFNEMVTAIKETEDVKKKLLIFGGIAVGITAGITFLCKIASKLSYRKGFTDGYDEGYDDGYDIAEEDNLGFRKYFEENCGLSKELKNE